MTQKDNPELKDELTQEDIEYLKLCLDAYTAAPLQDGLLQHYLGQAPQSDAAVEQRIEREGFDFREKLGWPRK